MRLLFSTVLLIILPALAFSQNNPGFLGKNRIIKVEHGLFIQNAEQPHGINDDAFAYSFIPSWADIRSRNRSRIGISYEQILKRKMSVTGSIHRYNSYGKMNSGFVVGNPLSEAVKADPGYFKASNTQLSAALRVYNRFAPVGLYFEVGVSGILYASEETHFIEIRNGEPVSNGIDEKITASGFTWMGHLGLGYNQFLSDELFIGFDMRLYMRSFGYIDDVSNLPLWDDSIPYEERFDMFTERNSLTAIAFGFTLSVGYMF